uniref:Uncharacterized protein n=1 Tax=Strigamia maritima TaxID=126957 RepID=T1ITL0_STRMM
MQGIGELKALLSKLTNQGTDNIRAACKKCGYVNPVKDIVLDVNSTRSESESEEELNTKKKEMVLFLANASKI